MATDDTQGLQSAPKKRSFLERIGFGGAAEPGTPDAAPASPTARKPRRKPLTKGRTMKPKTAPAPTDPRYRDLDPNSLQAIVRRDRIRRRMTWPAYAQFLGVHLSTLHKIATGVHRPSELTEAIIREALERNP